MRSVAAAEHTPHASARQETAPSTFRSIGELARKIEREARIKRHTTPIRRAARKLAA